MAAPLLVREYRWVCPNCPDTAVTREAEPHTRFHACRGLRGLTAPMVQEGVRAKVEARARDDYLNGDLGQRDGEGNVIASVVTTRDDGQDCTVLAPTATGKAI